MKLKKSTAIICVILLIITISIILINHFKNNYVNEPILKTAVHIDDLKNKNYILCKKTAVTGFDWRMIANNEEKNLNEFCNIIDENPFSELKLNYEFFLGQNTYIFYIEERNEYYTKELGKCVDYTVSGWDILFPVKREHPFIFKSNRYILASDTN